MSTETPKITLAKRAMESEAPIRKRSSLQAQLDKDLKAQNLSPTIKLSIGQPHIAGSPVQKQAIADLNSGNDIVAEGYSPAKGMPQYLRYATALINHRIPGLNVTDSNVLLTNGGAGALALISAALFDNEKYKVVFPTPGFASQPQAMRIFGANIANLPTHDTNYKISPSRLDKLLSDDKDISLVIFNDMTNPTGVKYSENELRALGDVFRKHPNVLIFSDETYHDLVFDTKSKFFLEVNPDLKNRTIIEYSTSKDIVGNPGLRGGIVYAPDITNQNGEIINLADKMSEQQYLLNAALPNLTQYITARAIEAKINKHYDEKTDTWQEGGRCHAEQIAWEASIRKQYESNINLTREIFQKVGMPPLTEPGGGFFLYIDASKFLGRTIPDNLTSFNGMKVTDLHKKVGGNILDTDTKIVTYLAYAANIVCVEASPFGMPAENGSIRISVAASQESLKQIPERIEFVEKLLSPKTIQQPAQETLFADKNNVIKFSELLNQLLEKEKSSFTLNIKCDQGKVIQVGG